MRLMVFGAGKMGVPVAADLCKRDTVSGVTLVDREPAALTRAGRLIDSDYKNKLDLRELDVVTQRDAAISLLREHHAAAILMPSRRASYAALEVAIAAGRSAVDILEEYHRHPDQEETEGLAVPQWELPSYGEWLHKRAVEAKITFLDGMGFEPGLTNVTAADGIRRLDAAHDVSVRVGGIPGYSFKNDKPLSYMISWSFEHVLREYMISTLTIENGELVPKQAADGIEDVHFDGFEEPLQAAFTPGMPSFPYTRRSLRNFNAKTLRWKGHWQTVGELKRLGLLHQEAITLHGAASEGCSATSSSIQTSPRKALSDLLTPRLLPRLGESDLCIMRTTVKGERGGDPVALTYSLMVEGEPFEPADSGNSKGLSAMAKVTAFPAAWATVALAEGRITTKGIVPPEDAIFADLYRDLVEYLRERGVYITES